MKIKKTHLYIILSIIIYMYINVIVSCICMQYICWNYENILVLYTYMKQMKEENKRQIFVLVYYYLFQYNNEVKYNKKSRRKKKLKFFFFSFRINIKF